MLKTYCGSRQTMIVKKNILVACAIIRDAQGKILATQRSISMSLPLKWEFPGGKVELGETYEQAVVREILEELSINILVIEKLVEVRHEYPEITVTLIPFLCAITDGQLKLNEHNAFNWINPVNLLDLDWAEADIPVVKNYLNLLNI
jgi:8-oxo-dGTP diphosphatase